MGTFEQKDALPWNLTGWFFDRLVHLYPIWVTFVDRGHRSRSKFKVTEGICPFSDENESQIRKTSSGKVDENQTGIGNCKYVTQSGRRYLERGVFYIIGRNITLKVGIQKLVL